MAYRLRTLFQRKRRWPLRIGVAVAFFGSMAATLVGASSTSAAVGLVNVLGGYGFTFYVFRLLGLLAVHAPERKWELPRKWVAGSVLVVALGVTTFGALWANGLRVTETEQVYICSGCDFGNVYCNKGCRKIGRRESVREAGANYQRTAGSGKARQAAGAVSTAFARESDASQLDTSSGQREFVSILGRGHGEGRRGEPTGQGDERCVGQAGWRSARTSCDCWWTARIGAIFSRPGCQHGRGIHERC